MSDLPENWVSAVLSDISTIEMGQSPDSSTYNDEGKGLPFFQGKAEFGKLHPIARKWCTDPKKIAEAGDILLSVRAPVGPTNLASEKCCIGRGLAAIRAKELIDQKYLLHYFRNIEPWLSQQGTGSTFAAISGSFIRDLQIPLAPLDEQKRIAEKLDSLLTRVDSCQSHLERVPQILKRFRQSVLAAATSGRLTEDWRKDDKEIEYGEFTFPASWELSTFDDALTLIDGDRGPNYPKQSDYQESGHCLFLSTKNVRKFGFEFDDVVFISEEKHKKLRSGTLQYGDVIITTRGTLGNVAYYDETIPYKVIRINSGMLILRKKQDNLLGKFLMICIGSPLFTNELEEKRSGSAQPQIPAKTLKTFALPIPSLEEQAEIVRRVEKLFAYAERLEARYLSASERVERLTPSLLAKAFCGELVEQDPNDESAEKLLERIKEAIAKAPKESKKSQRRTTMKSTKSKQDGKRISIVQALQEAGKALSSDQLFAAAGFPSDAEPDLVEEFFVEIRDALKNKQITRERKGDLDWFSLAK